MSLHNIGNVYSAKGNYDEALDRIENLLKLKPEEFLLNILKTTILKLRGQEKEANKILRNLDLDLYPSKEFQIYQLL